MGNAFYNDSEPYVAEWLRNLIAAGYITGGTVDQRSIETIEPADLVGFSRCHFFAGIAGWEYALHLAGWPDARPVWTASLPCQPFSAAGSRKGGEDDRHLWPVFFRLVRERKPSAIFGEQVEAAIGHGWLDRVFADLEAEDYACGAVTLSAASAGAPHNRPRIYWIAASNLHGNGFAGAQTREASAYAKRNVPAQKQTWNTVGYPSFAGVESSRQVGSCLVRDFPRMDDGIPGNVDAIRAYGNAIVPQVAAQFIKTFMECEE